MWVRGKDSELTGHTSANSGDNNAEQQRDIKPLRPAGEKEQHPRVPLLTLKEAEKSREVSLRYPPQAEPHFRVTQTEKAPGMKR